MGWDAYAYRQDGTPVSRENMTHQEKLWFTKASNTVIKISGAVDSGLKSAYLDTSSCGRAISKMLGVDMFSLDNISSEFIKDNLEDKYEAYWDYQSAYHFLVGCVKFGYNIQFSW